MTTTDFAAVYARIQSATGCKTQAELADFFDIRQSSVSDAKRRGSIPADWLLTLLEKKSLNPHWIKTGSGDRYLVTSSAEPAAPSGDALLTELSGPLPPQWLTDAIASAACDICLTCLLDGGPRCPYKAEKKAMAVCRAVRGKFGVGGAAHETFPDDESAETLFPTAEARRGVEEGTCPKI